MFFQVAWFENSDHGERQEVQVSKTSYCCLWHFTQSCSWNNIILVQVQFRQKYYSCQVRHDLGPTTPRQYISCSWDTRLNHWAIRDLKEMYCHIFLFGGLRQTCNGFQIDRHTSNQYFWFKYNLDRSTTHPKCNTTRVWTHDLQIVDSTFYVCKMLVLTTEPSGISHFDIVVWTLFYSDDLAVVLWWGIQPYKEGATDKHMCSSI